MNTNWVCQICHKPAPDHCVIEVINSNIDHGSIGGYPVMASEDEQAATERLRKQVAEERGLAPEEVVFSLDDVTNWLTPQINIAFVVRHIACTRDQDNQGYLLGADRANTLDEWAGWVIHLSKRPGWDETTLCGCWHFGGRIGAISRLQTCSDVRAYSLRQLATGGSLFRQD
jgi:hypothetical protein